MYNKKDILKILNEYNYFIDEQVLSSFVKNWKIDAIYEDEDGVEYFDNLSIAKIKKGISLKAQGYDNEKIVYYTSKILSEKQEEEKLAQENMQTQVIPTQTGSEIKNFTVDMTSQTLQMLAEALASKVTEEIKEQVLNKEFIQEIFDDKLKKDNEELSKRVNDLLDDNKQLAKRVEQLESKKKTFFEWLRNIF